MNEKASVRRKILTKFRQSFGNSELLLQPIGLNNKLYSSYSLKISNCFDKGFLLKLLISKSDSNKNVHSSIIWKIKLVSDGCKLKAYEIAENMFLNGFKYVPTHWVPLQEEFPMNMSIGETRVIKINESKIINFIFEILNNNC